VQAAEGVTFAIVPFIQPTAIGPVAGLVGAGGNLGAMLYAFVIFSSVPDHISYTTAWIILACVTFVCAFPICLIQFTDEEIAEAEEMGNTFRALAPLKKKNNGEKQLK
jgi:NNP family nitrate/nitrite transporter-like MFS transporter